MELVACFTGHRPKSFKFNYNEEDKECVFIKKQLERIIDRAIELGYNLFICGMALGVDTWAAEIIIEKKKSNPNIKLECAIPCEKQFNNWPYKAQERYFDIINKADIKTMVSNETYKPELMIKRDQYMVDKSSLVIGVWNKKVSGTGHTIKYASDKGKLVIYYDLTTKSIKRIN